jgi:hypothetical protein
VIAAALEKSVFSFRRASIQERKENGMSPKDRILFICRHNSGRSQIAAAYLEKYAGFEMPSKSGFWSPAVKRPRSKRSSKNERRDQAAAEQTGLVFRHPGKPSTHGRQNPLGAIRLDLEGRSRIHFFRSAPAVFRGLTASISAEAT